MKVRDASHSGKKVSFNVQDPIGEQLENLTSLVYNISMQKEENNQPFKPQIYQKRGRGQNRQNFGNRDRSRAFNSDRQRQNFRPNNRGWSQNRQPGNINGSGNYTCQNYGRKDTRDRVRQNFRRSFNNDNRSRGPTPRGNGNRRYNSPNAILGTRSRSKSRVITNSDRGRCLRCREYDHFANGCPNMGTDDLDGYESDRAAL